MLTQKKIDEKYKQAAKQAAKRCRRGINNILVLPRQEKSIEDYNKFKDMPKQRNKRAT